MCSQSQNIPKTLILSCLLAYSFYTYVELSSYRLTETTQALTLVANVAVSNLEIKSIPGKRKGLIILTHYRSGSSFLGEYFNQRKDSFYMFEPLIPFGKCINQARKVEYLRKLFTCDIQHQAKLFKTLDKSSNVWRKPGFSPLKECLIHNFCFRQHVKQLCTEEMCNRKVDKCSLCKPVKTRMASDLCKSANIIVIKVIRICEIEYLKPLLQDASLDIKIIHLVRDPRAQYKSLEMIDNSVDHYKEVAERCRRIENNWKTAIKDGNKWLIKKYKLVRYEDLCRYPLEIAHKIYSFVGFGMTDEMKEWISANSHANFSFLIKEQQSMKLKEMKRFKSGVKVAPALTVREVENLKRRIFQNPFSTIRNSSTNWKKWTTTLSSYKAMKIQRICSLMMRSLKYVKFKDDFELDSPWFEPVGSFCADQRRNLTLTDCDTSF